MVHESFIQDACASTSHPCSPLQVKHSTCISTHLAGTQSASFLLWHSSTLRWADIMFLVILALTFLDPQIVVHLVFNYPPSFPSWWSLFLFLRPLNFKCTYTYVSLSYCLHSWTCFSLCTVLIYFIFTYDLWHRLSFSQWLCLQYLIVCMTLISDAYCTLFVFCRHVWKLDFVFRRSCPIFHGRIMLHLFVMGTTICLRGMIRFESCLCEKKLWFANVDIHKW